MADIATIGFRAETNELKQAKGDLEAIVPAAKQAENAAGSFSKKASDLGNTLSGKVTQGLSAVKAGVIGLVAGFAAISLGGLIASFQSMAERLDQISKAASKMKTAIPAVQGLAAAADLSGVGLDQLSSSVTRMDKVLGTAIAKGKESEGVFKVLGISAKELAAMPVPDRLGEIADRMNSMNLSADETAIVLGALGDRMGNLTALMEGGSAGIKDATDMIERFGGTISSDAGKQVEAMNDAFTSISYAIGAVSTQVVAFLAPFLTPVFSGIAETIGAINRAMIWLASSTSVTATAIRALIAPFAFMANTIISSVSSVVDWINKKFGVDIPAIVKTAANTIINAFSGAYQAIGVIFDGLPAMLGAAAYGAAKLALDGINKFVQGTIQGMVSIAQSISSIFGVEVGKGFDASKIFDASATEMYKGIDAKVKQYNDAVSGIFDQASDTFKGQMKQDWFASDAIDKATEATKNYNTSPDGVKALIENNEKAASATKNAASAAKEQKSALELINEELTKMSAPFDQAKSAFDKLNEMQKNGIVTGDQYTAMLGRIKDAFMATGGTAEQWSKVIAGKTSEMTTALKDFSTNALTQTGDAIADLMVSGKADFKALAESIIKDAIRMAWQMMVVKPLIGSIFGFESGGVFPAGVSAFAKGGMFGANDNVKRFAGGGAFTNQVVSSPTLFKFAGGDGFGRLGVMGEAGPEAVMPLRRGRDGKLGIGITQNGGGGMQRDNARVLSFGDINMTIESSGDEAQDHRTAQLYADALEGRIRKVATDVLGAGMTYGGAFNPRGNRS